MVFLSINIYCRIIIAFALSCVYSTRIEYNDQRRNLLCIVEFETINLFNIYLIITLHLAKKYTMQQPPYKHQFENLLYLLTTLFTS